MKWIAHRSGPTVYPEQTIASARHALENGADIVEIDVRFTADKRIAVSHDKNLSRVFGEDLECDAITAQRFRALRHVSDASFGSHLLEDYLACGVAPLLIHIKENAVIAELLRIMDEYGGADRAIMGVADVASAAQVRAHDPAIRILSFAPKAEDTAAFAAVGVDYIRLWEKWLTEENVRLVKESGAALWVMSGGAEPGHPVGEPSVEGLYRIAQWEPDGILVNDVPFARAALEEE